MFGPSKALRRALPGAALSLAALAGHAAPTLGVYRWDAPRGPANVDDFGRWLGTPAMVATAFAGRASWRDLEGAAWQLGPWSQWVAAEPGRNLSLAVGLLPKSGGSLSSCGAGEYDAHWTKLADNLAAHGLRSIYLRLGWEMDGTWFAWGAPQGSGKEGHFAACFRRVVQAMRAAQPQNQWKFVWNPGFDGWKSAAFFEATWPGDEYVDIVGVDIYDQSWAPDTYPYPGGCDEACRLRRQKNAWQVHSWRLNTLRDFAIARGKPMALPEWGVIVRRDGHGGGDNPYFIGKMHEFITDPRSNVAFHSYFTVTDRNNDSRLTESIDWDRPDGPTRLPRSAALFQRLFGPR